MDGPQIQTPPLLCLQHFRGNLDNWDPRLVDRIAQDREVILLANRGVGSSTSAPVGTQCKTTAGSQGVTGITFAWELPSSTSH
jgi:pimeloyl-ACP methyl ester carboxylesterase